MNSLARQIAYEKQSKITAREMQAQQNTSSCLALIMVAIVYSQTKEIKTLLKAIVGSLIK